MKRVFFVVFFSFLFLGAKAQRVDSLAIAEELLSKALLLQEVDTSGQQDLFQKALRLGERHDYIPFLAKARREYGDFLFKHTYYHRAFGSYIKSREYYRQLENAVGETELTMKIALAQLQRGNTRLAAREYLEAIQLAKTNNLDYIRDEANENLGLVYYQLQQYTEAEERFKSALDIKEKIHEVEGYIRLCLQLSNMYLDLNKYDSSLVYAQLAIDHCDETKHKEDKLQGFVLVTQNYLLKNDPARAYPPLMHLQRFIEDETSDVIHKRKGNQSIKTKSCTLLGCYHLLNGDEKEANKWLKKAMDLAGPGPIPDSKIYHYRMVAEMYKLQGNYDKAFEAQANYLNYMREMLNTDNLKNLSNINALVEKSENDDKIKLLHIENKLKELQLVREKEKAFQLIYENALKDSLLNSQLELATALDATNKNQQFILDNEIKLKEIQQQKLRNANRLRTMLLSFLTMAILFGLIIYLLYKKQAAKNILIQKQAEELKYLMKEIHHRVKNNLQVVSSMLNLQSKYIHDPDAVEAVRDSKNRVMSMALIHQRLYQESDARTIDICEYIDLLMQNLMVTFNVDQNRINIKADIDQIFLKEDFLTPIGLILNELITNCFKYAFPDGRSGNVHIQIKHIKNQIEITVADDGIGIERDVNIITSSSTFGHKMISSFLQKLKGSMHIENNSGTKIKITIPKVS